MFWQMHYTIFEKIDNLSISDNSDVHDIITDRHPNPWFSVCIISPNVVRKIMQTNSVRKMGAVFFGRREIIRGNLTRTK